MRWGCFVCIASLHTLLLNAHRLGFLRSQAGGQEKGEKGRGGVFFFSILV